MRGNCPPGKGCLGHDRNYISAFAFIPHSGPSQRPRRADAWRSGPSAFRPPAEVSRSDAVGLVRRGADFPRRDAAHGEHGRRAACPTLHSSRIHHPPSRSPGVPAGGQQRRLRSEGDLLTLPLGALSLKSLPSLHDSTDSPRVWLDHRALSGGLVGDHLLVPFRRSGLNHTDAPIGRTRSRARRAGAARSSAPRHDRGPRGFGRTRPTLERPGSGRLPRKPESSGWR
jgi:hypothetical protein